MVKVFYALIPSGANDYDFNKFSLERESYVKSINNKKRFSQSYYVWKLLLTIFEKLNVDFSNGFNVVNGKWELKDKKPYFSLAHSENVVAVSVSFECKNGVDVQIIDEKIFRVKEKLGVQNDISKEDLTKKWTEREVKIKNPSSNFFIHEIITDNASNNYVLSVGAENNFIALFEKINL